MRYNRKKKKELLNNILKSRQEMDDLQEFFPTVSHDDKPRLAIQASPFFHIEETETYYKIDGELENITLSAVEFDIANNRLFIIGKRNHIEMLKYMEWQWEEESYSDYHRSFIIPEDADCKKTTVRCNKKMLQIKIPKKD
ncbi:Hsp20/alpha crystallin family protein [Bacillus taeanensis]|uniref:SHSP domain-containing protein n=1 Tax=Bacillus taeanensis TaxID=273032 RepID=A0A366XXV6_9BACI|nr:Hsp20/alpha crystallin family protein [Bacillus taeanensis]RBW70972.1 hypothetical protein DS031_02965 [Bacillus taeanensis]